MARRVPYLRSITLTNASQTYNLQTLVAAKDSSFAMGTKCQMVSLQVDVGAGAAHVFIVDPDNGSNTDVGADLVATQAWSISSLESNLINLKDIGLRTDTNATRVNVTLVVR